MVVRRGWGRRLLSVCRKTSLHGSHGRHQTRGRGWTGSIWNIHRYKYAYTAWLGSILVTGLYHDGHSNENVNKQVVLSQRWPRNAPYTWVPWKFSVLSDYAHGYYSQHFHGLLFQSNMWMFLQNLKSVALSVPEIIGGTQKIWAVPGYAHAHFTPTF